jgi:hypothetical protein
MSIMPYEGNPNFPLFEMPSNSVNPVISMIRFTKGCEPQLFKSSFCLIRGQPLPDFYPQGLYCTNEWHRYCDEIREELGI